MKKISIFTILIFIFSISFMDIKAIETNSSLMDYTHILNEFNEKFDADLYILNEDEFMNSPIRDNYNDSYFDYINSILSIDIDTFKKNCLDIINIETIYETQIIHNNRSTFGNKTVSFNNGRNTMTLTYKYSGTKFDTSYKPTATVAKISTTNYFVMSNYTGSFKNSNSTYSVTANGNLYSSFGVVSKKTFIVNFNL